MDIANIIKMIAIYAVPLVFAVCLHEAAHGFMAYRLGDPTARALGRLTLNPLRHIDLLGTVIIPLILVLSQVGIIIGYAKPVPVNPYNFKNPKRDMMWVALSGPGTNFILALLSGMLFRVILYAYPELTPLVIGGGASSGTGGGVALWFLGPLLLMLRASVLLNVILGVFNLVPIPPLDGGRILMGLLPDRYAQQLGRVEPFGFFILIFLIFLDPFGIMRTFVFGLMKLLYWIFLFG